MARTTGMIRTVVTEEDARRKNGLPDNPDDYKTRLLKYIPAEAVALYTALVGIPESLKEQSSGWYWFGLILVFVAGLVAVPLVLMRGYGMKWQYKKRQIICPKRGTSNAPSVNLAGIRRKINTLVERLDKEGSATPAPPTTAICGKEVNPSVI
jgi:hypothetical protein